MVRTEYVLTVLLGHICPSAAFPSYGWQVPNGQRVHCPPGAVGCLPGDAQKMQPASTCFGLGHNTCAGGSLPLNPFGVALKAAEYKWTKELCEADSDGDGRTNGEELGDPCCLWEKSDTPSDYMASFAAMHPGFKEHVPAPYIRPVCASTTPTEKAAKMGTFNAGEEQRHMDFYIDNYTIPAEVTTYTNFAWNFNDTSHTVFHVVLATAIVKTPKNLHHYVVRGCAKQFPEELHGKVLSDELRMSHGCSMDFGGWAPGKQIVETTPWLGRPIGKDAGVIALMVAVHFNNPAKENGVISRDGMRVFYTPTLRPSTYTTVYMMQISMNPVITLPAGHKRLFMTRSCKLTVVNSTTGKPAKANLFAASFHAHLLGRQMFAKMTSSNGTVVDLSQPIWNFDDQASQDLLPRHMSIETGDHVQSSCVFDSTERTESTSMGLSTFDEMCWSSLSYWPPHEVVCEGNAWLGELSDTDDARDVERLRPECAAGKAWPMSNLMFGGQMITPKACPPSTIIITTTQSSTAVVASAAPAAGLSTYLVMLILTRMSI